MPALSWPAVWPDALFTRTALLSLLSELSQGAIINKLTQLLDELQPELRWALSLDSEQGAPHELIRCGVPDPADRAHSVLAREALQSQGPVFTEQPAALADCFSPTVALQRGIATALPVIGPGQVLGCLEFYGWLSEGALARLRVVVDGLGAAMLNAWRYERTLADSRHDDTTGLLNPRALRETLHTEVARADRFGHPISMLFVDLDHFKRVNDRHGHPAGSALLREVGQRLEGCVRRVDAVYRYGGDEFALLLIETGLDDAERVAGRVLRRLSETPFRLAGGAEVALQASVGVATYPGDGANADELLEWADRAMFAAKEGGRDRVVSTQDLPPRASTPETAPAQPPSTHATEPAPTPETAQDRSTHATEPASTPETAQDRSTTQAAPATNADELAEVPATATAPAPDRRAPDPVAAAVTRELAWSPRPERRAPSQVAESLK